MSLNGKTTASTTTDTVITNPLSFFPDIELQAFIDNYRLPGEYNEAPLVYELKSAIRQVNEALKDSVLILQSVIVAETLKAFQADLVDTYIAAVMHWARAGLIKYFETINRKAPAEIQGERNEIIVTEWKGEALNNIDLLNKNILKVAADNGALGTGRRDYADGFRASII
ncbi:head completion/stabilization protein [Marinomonas transparens]|uniref:Head completion/stabilization protein n=1 Tax=Marinomonas transparens TaxID=2795388 RepID=A0A934JRC4_9GAMM|nr:head completion/stabilization protein [Marinomonas transparens]MBJ7536957.1 head completion/stabilization protein [Marinomonas transparens]